MAQSREGEGRYWKPVHHYAGSVVAAASRGLQSVMAFDRFFFHLGDQYVVPQSQIADYCRSDSSHTLHIDFPSSRNECHEPSQAGRSNPHNDSVGALVRYLVSGSSTYRRVNRERFPRPIGSPLR